MAECLEVLRGLFTVPEGEPEPDCVLLAGVRGVLGLVALLDLSYEALRGVLALDR